MPLFYKNTIMSWTPSSGREFPIKQQPTYSDQNKLNKIEDELRRYPPLIFAGEARTLKEHLAKVVEEKHFYFKAEIVLRALMTLTQQQLKIYLN